MIRILLIVLLVAVVVGVLTACGGGATTGEAAEPSASAPRISPDVYENTVASTEHVLVDVRTPAEVSSTGAIPGAVNIPLDQLPNRLNELPQDMTVVIYCRTGSRSRQAVNILSRGGYDQLLDLQGIQQWQSAGKNLVPLQ